MRTHRLSILLALVAASVSVFAGSAHAERALLPDKTPAEMEGASLTERLGERAPLDLTFTNANGESVQLSEYFEDGKPVVLTLNFYKCEMLCDLTLNGLLDVMNESDLVAGRDFEVVTVSFNHEETTDMASVKQRGYRASYKHGEIADANGGGWHFHTGTEANIKQLCDAVGFGFKRIEKIGQFAHTSTIIFITPDGVISRYMNNVVFQPDDFRLASVEASEGSIGSPLEKFLLFTCFIYDPDANSYAMSAFKLMRLGGVLTIFAIAAGLFMLWLRSPQRTPVHGVAS